MREPFELKIVEHIATLGDSGTYTRELNVVSFNNRPARLDVRLWKQDGEREQSTLEGHPAYRRRGTGAL